MSIHPPRLQRNHRNHYPRLTAYLRQWLTVPVTKPSDPRWRFWFYLSLIAGLIMGLLVVQQAFVSEYVVQDDARQHVFWMRRYLDPGLFPNDLIADYYQSIAPWGYAVVYRLFTLGGLDPILVSKILPLPLGLIATGYCFGVSLQLLPVPAAGFVATVLLNQNLWMEDDLVSGTARAFLYPLFLAFLYYLLRRALLPCLAAIALEGLIYPQFVFIMAGVMILQVLRWNKGLHLGRDLQDYLFCAAGLGMALMVLLPYALSSSEYGPVVSAAAAKAMPEFSAQGRTRFFVDNPWEFWLTGKRTGALLWVMPLCMLSPVLLPITLRARMPLANRVRNLVLLLQVFIVSLGIFLAAHSLLFRLYLPSRYLQNSLQIITPLAAGIAVIILLDGLFRWAGSTQSWLGQVGILATTLGLGAILAFSPSLYKYPNSSYIVGNPSLYEFFAQRPKDTLIASLNEAGNSIPTFSRRSILTNREYSIPYQVGYYRQIRQRTIAQIQAQYTQDLAEVQRFIRIYGVDLWLLDRAYLQTTFVDSGRYFHTNLWIQQYQPVVRQMQAKLNQGATPALTKLVDRCSVFAADDLVVLEAACILNPP